MFFQSFLFKSECIPKLPIRQGECTHNHHTLFGNVMVHCKKESFYEVQTIQHLVWMLHGLQSSDLTLLGPKLASGAVADRPDVYSGSVNVKGWFPTELFTSETLHLAAPIGSPCVQHENKLMTYLTLDLHPQGNLVGNSFQES